MKSPLRLFFTPLGVPYQGEKGGLGAALTAEGVSQDRCNSSLGERALGCGRWTCALTEASQSDVRSLMRAPLGRSVKRGAWRATRKHQSCRFKEPTDLLLSGSESGPERPHCFRRARRAPERSSLTGLDR